MHKERGTGLMSWVWNRRRGLAPAMLIALLPALFGGCYGAFPLTHKIYQLNDEVSPNKLVKTVVMWVFIIIPVYEVGMFVDAVVFNLIEFWTGDKIVAIGPTTDSNGNTVCLTPSPDGRQAELTVSRDGKVVMQAFFVKVSDTTFEVRDAQGDLQGKVLKAADGSISLTDRNGVVMRTLPGVALARIVHEANSAS